MKLTELPAANDLLDDPAALADRYRRDGCLLLRGAVPADRLAPIADQATAVLEGWGIAERDTDGMPRWNGAPVPVHDEVDLDRTDAMAEFDAAIGAGTDPLRAVAAALCGTPMVLWRGTHVFAALPDDPAHATVPHQDGYALSPDGDYRRFWIALSDIPFGDGGLAVAAGSHRGGRYPVRDGLPGFARRPSAEYPVPDPARGIDPATVTERWHTAAMRPGDLIVFHSELVHRGIPATSNRIRLSLAVIASAEGSPRPPHTFTTAQDRQRRARIRELAASHRITEKQFIDIAADLNHNAVDITPDTVREAIGGAYRAWRDHAPAQRR